MRESGYYWVEYDGRKVIAEFVSTMPYHGYWYYWCTVMSDADFSHIYEERIKEPD